MASKKRPSTAKVISGKAFDGDNSAVLKQVKEFASQQIQDPFTELYRQGSGTDEALQIIPPPFNPEALARVPYQNNVLLQCVDAMITNCELTGHSVVFVGEDQKQEKDKAAIREKRRITDFLGQPNGKETLRSIRKKIRRDLETLGYWFMEVGRDASGEIAWIEHIPAASMRVCQIDPEDVEVTRTVQRNGKEFDIETTQNFRRYVQQVGSKKVWFKEFSDPRPINSEDGKVLSEDELDEKPEANEIIHHSLSGGPYGLPRWINNITSALGSREMELVNLQFFKDNAIPAMAILVSGGYLTAETVDELEEHFGSAKGKDSINRVLIIEAKPDEESVGDTSTAPPTPSLHMEPLGGQRQSDALFAEYDKENQAKLRSSFRLPPGLVGRSEDYTYATAQASIDMAENQVFGPERQDFDDVMNTKVLTYEGRMPKFYRFRSNVAKLSDAQSIMNAMANLNTMGAITPNFAITQVRELFGINVPLIKEEWGNVPFELVRAALNMGIGISDQTMSAIDTIQKTFDSIRSKNLVVVPPVNEDGQQGKARLVRDRSRKPEKRAA